MKVALIQTNAQVDKARNLEQAARLDLEEVERVRARMPCAQHRVL